MLNSLKALPFARMRGSHALRPVTEGTDAHSIIVKCYCIQLAVTAVLPGYPSLYILASVILFPSLIYYRYHKDVDISLFLACLHLPVL